MSQNTGRSALTSLEKVLAAVARIHPGEGVSVALFFLGAFLLLFVYYLLKPVRDALILTQGTPELRSYALAIQAILLVASLPLYNRMFHRMHRLSLLRAIILFFAANLLVFFGLGLAQFNVGLAFFVWLGIISLTLVAEFWAFSADVFNVAAGHRLFALIAAGASLGSLAGAEAAKLLFSLLGPYGLMCLAAAALGLSAYLLGPAERSVPAGSRTSPDQDHAPKETTSTLKGLRVVLRDRYLLLIAAFVLLLNCINSTGEFILAQAIVEQANAALSLDPALNKNHYIGTLYGNYYFWVNLISLGVQLLLVRRLWQLVGIPATLAIAPLIAVIGYGMVCFLPVFSLIYLYKIAENSTDYSVQSTTRHTLFLPLSRAKKYNGKTFIETLVWRLGDLIQALLVYVGLNVFGFGIAHFAIVNFILSLLWLVVALAIGMHYKQLRQH
jgi:AAA family ATP:ADP antiporter